MSGNLTQLEKALRKIAKHSKSIKYTKGLLFAFLMTGMMAFSAEVTVKDKEIEQTKVEINDTVKDLKNQFRIARIENEKLLRNANIDLIQLTEQGEQVIKSPWSSWQFGANYYNNSWNGMYKGRGDKAEKYPYEGIFTRSRDLFLRNISPDSVGYNEYIEVNGSSENPNNSATTSIRNRNRRGRLNYGLETSIIRQEPVLQIELGASINPRIINKNPVNVNVSINPIQAPSPIQAPPAPTQPSVPQITINKFDPKAPAAPNVTLAISPTFNIQLGSYRNFMTQNVNGPDGNRLRGSGLSYDSGTSDTTLDDSTSGLTDGNPTLIYSWSSPSPSLGNVVGTGFNSAILKAYFDYTNMGGGAGNRTLTLSKNLTIDSINTLNQTERNTENIAGRTWNTQKFLVGGSRISTLDNARGGATIKNSATINLVGPLVVGFEVQSDTLGGGVRTLENSLSGVITDKSEESGNTTNLNGTLSVGTIYDDGRAGSVAIDSTNLTLPPIAGGGTLNIERVPDILDNSNNIIKRGGYTGYKIGLILTYENIDTVNGNEYRLINNGKIDFKGGNSIGVQIFAPDSPSKVTVENKSNSAKIILGGVASYGLKLSSRVSSQSSVINSGRIFIQGDNTKSYDLDNNQTTARTGLFDGDANGIKDNLSLSSGIAVLENNAYTNAKSIRAYNGLVVNNGQIDVSGGKGNTGMVLIVNAPDDITNTGLINVSGTGNIGMRVDKGTVMTDAPGDPISNNLATIIVKGESDTDANIGMVSNKAAISNNRGGIELFGTNAVGMNAESGGTINNISTRGINGQGDTLIGMVIKDSTSKGTNSGTIKLSGTNITGVYNNSGTFEMTGGIIETSGANSVSLYSKGTGTTKPNNTTTPTSKITGGKISASNGSLGLFSDFTVIELGGNLELEANGAGTLLFYNYTSTPPAGVNSGAEGIFRLTGNITGKIENGATAFYFKDTTPGTSTGTTEEKLNNMFSGSGSNKIKLALDDNSTLFVLDNTAPTNTSISLRSINADSINNFLGNSVKIDLNNSSKNFKAYSATKSYLNIDTDVDLDNHTPAAPGAAIDNYYRVDFINSKVDVDSGKKITGTKDSKLDVVIAQANYAGSLNRNNVVVTNNGIIDFSKDGGTAIAVDFGEATNNGTIIMKDDTNPITKNKVALFGASNSLLTNNGEIQLGTKSVGIWGANRITSSESNWDRNINIANTKLIKGISGTSGLFGIYVDNDTARFPSAIATINHSGNIDFSENTGSTGIYAKNANLLSSGDITVKDESVGVNATNSKVDITGGNYNIGKKSVAFKLDGNSSEFRGVGNINIRDVDSVAYILTGTGRAVTQFNSTGASPNFVDNLVLNSNGNKYTYISIKDATLNYENTKTISSDGTVFINADDSNIDLMANASINSTNKGVIGVYSKGFNDIKNKGKIELTGDDSTAIYGNNSTVTNDNGNIKIGNTGSGIYVENGTGTNDGRIEIGKGSIGIVTVGGAIRNDSNGVITSSSTNAIGMTQDGNRGSIDIINNGIITLTGDQSIGMHSKNAIGSILTPHTILNVGIITIGDSVSSTSPSVGIYSENAVTGSVIENRGTVRAGNRSIGIYGKDIVLKGNATTEAGDGGIAVYSNEGKVTIEENAKLSVGKSLGTNEEGVVVYLAGNSQTLKSETSNIIIGDGSFGYVNTGSGNNMTIGKDYSGVTPISAPHINLNKKSIFIYSNDSTGEITNYNNLRSLGDENYGIYTSGKANNYGNIDFSNGVGNVGLYSYNENLSGPIREVINYGEIKVSKSDITNVNDKKYGIGMAAGYSEETPLGSGNKVLKATGHVINRGTIKVTEENSIGMYATGSGSIAENDVNGVIELSGNKRNIGIYVEEGATVINRGTIRTVGTGNKKQIGIAVIRGILDNRGIINIDAEGGHGLLLVGAIIKNYGDINITTGGGATKVREVEAKDLTKTLGDEGLDTIKINAPVGAAESTITLNGVVKTPVIANVQSIANRLPNDIPTSSIGMYVDTSGINYTKPINNIGKLAGLIEADLIVGTEATKYTNSKYIQLSQEMIEPYNDMIRTSGIERWSIYSGALTWMATITQQTDFTIRNAYLAKVPYTVFSGDKNTTRDTYNFLDGLEQRYDMNELNSKEKLLFSKLNNIGNNEGVLFSQATDEMMGHQYANTQQRINATGNVLDKEFNYLRKEWENTSKDSNKVKVFGSREEYNTDTAGVIDYISNSYGVAYSSENETIKLGNSSGWYAGYVQNRFKFKDIGKSKETQNMIKAGIYNTKSFDDNGSLQWTISGEGFVGQNEMTRRFLVVDEIFKAKGNYYTYGAGLKNEISKDIRMTERTSIRPYGALDIEYGRFTNIKEKDGEVRLEVKGNDYYSIKPEVGVEFKYKQPMAVKTNLVASLGVAYENELGKVADGKNKARVGYTEADYFNIRGEKEDRKGNFKADFKLGIENTRFGVTFNAGYDTKGENVRGGIGFRAIF